MKFYYFNEGIQKLGKELYGDENICLAIRPYGFHAGNQIPLVIYPYLLCQELVKNKKEPRFTIYLVFNDWEQLKLDGPNVELYPFNVYPKDTILQYTPDTDKKYKSIVDHWGPKIALDVKSIEKEYPYVKVKVIKYSEIKSDKRMVHTLTRTLKDPNVLLEIFKNYTSKTILNSPSEYAIAVCPLCKMTKGTTRLVNEETVEHFCRNCFKISKGELQSFDFWLYHVPLALPRFQILDIDLCITGADKLDESTYVVREKLAEAFGVKLKMPDVLYAPLVVDKKGISMGKSKGNYKYVPTQKLSQIVKQNINTDKLVIN